MLLITLYTDTVVGLLVTATVLVVDEFGWRTFVATVWRQVSHSVDTTTGALMTVDIMKTSLSHAIPVLL